MCWMNRSRLVSSAIMAGAALSTLLAAGLGARAEGNSLPPPSGSAARAIPAGAASAVPPTKPAPPAASTPATTGALSLQPLPPVGESDGGASTWGTLPDPRPLVAAEQWVLDLQYRDGEVTLRDARKEALNPPSAIPRHMGRFVLELYIGGELLERTRFDFPLLGAGEYVQKRQWNSPPSFERFARSTLRVAVPNSSRATRLILLDRASGQAWNVPWPPPAMNRPLPQGPATTATGLDAGPPR